MNQSQLKSSLAYLGVFDPDFNVRLAWFQMTLNYRVIVERYPFPVGVVNGSSPAVKSPL